MTGGGVGCVRDTLGRCQAPAHEHASTVLVWPVPPVVFVWLLLLGVVVVAGWWHLRGEDACLLCGEPSCSKHGARSSG